MEPAKKNLILTGFMATGKTQVGRELAARLGRSFLDTDSRIEEESGLTIPQIFARYGEQYFRDLESRIIYSIDRFHPGELVVSTGGGAILRKANREHLLRQGIVILLTASPDSILQRIKEQGGRPLLEGGDLREKIETLWAEREPYYRQCHLQVDTSGRDPEEVAAKIIHLLGLQ